MENNTPVTSEQVPEMVALLLKEVGDLKKQIGDMQGQRPQVRGDDLVKIDVASEITGLKKSTIYGLVHKGKIPVIKNGRLWFRSEDLQKWKLEKH